MFRLVIASQKHKLYIVARSKFAFSRGAKAWTLFCLEQQILFHIFVVWHPYNESWVGRLLLTLGILIYKVIKVIKPSKICENFFPQSYSWTCQFWSLHKEKSKYEKKNSIEHLTADLWPKTLKPEVSASRA